jgi:hypothetical protein
MQKAALAAVLVAILPACRPAPGTAAPAAPASRDIFTALVVAPGEFAEINLTMAKGAAATAVFTSTEAAAWDVHSHAGEQVTVHAEGSSAADRVRFVAERDGMVSFMWQNKGTDPLTLDVELQTEGRVDLHSTHPKR